jgi:hypothetical protein
MILRRFFTLIVLALLLPSLCSAMSFDNRFFPLIAHPYVTVIDRPSHAASDLFVMTSSRAFDQFDNEVGIPQLYGLYDQQDIAQAIVALGNPNPLPTVFQGNELPWILDGRIQAQGFDFGYHQAIGDLVSVGGTWFFMHVNSRQRFTFKKNDTAIFTQSEELQLDDLRRSMQAQLGLGGPNSDQIGVGDGDIYLRVGNWWDYVFKFRRIEAGGRLGVLVPSGEIMNIYNPASLPFSGDGHWGMYVAADTELELKEDWKFGVLLRLNKRFPKTCVQRMPVNKEPYVFGAVVGPARVNPGFTFIFYSYLSFENLRQGLGARLQYSAVYHGTDCWTDMRPNKTVPVNLARIQELSSWGADYITLTVFYDFGKVKVDRGLEPIVNLAWDIPVSLLIGRSVARTNKISLGIEINF